MSLRRRLAIFVVLDALLLVAIAFGSYWLTDDIESMTSERLRLGAEFRSVRRVHRLVLEEILAGNQVMAGEATRALESFRAGLKAIDLELRELQTLPPTRETQEAMLDWQRENSEYEVLLERLAASPEHGASAATAMSMRSTSELETLRVLTAHGEDQLAVIGRVGDALRRRIDEADVRVRRRMELLWWQLASLCVLPVVIVVVLLAGFARDLSRRLDVLQASFARLGQGDFSVRAGKDGGGADEIGQVLDGFDRMAEQLEALQNLRSRFYSMAAHDLRSPLSTILLAVHQIRAPESDEQVRKSMVDVVERKASSLLRLVEGLMKSLLLHSGQLVALRQRVDINALLRALGEELASRAAQRDQKIRVEAMAGDPTLWCDPSMLEQILENLLSNALKYSRKGDEIRLGAREIDGGSVQFHVTDSGPGIAEDDRKAIFEPFVRRSGPDDGVHGHGLGLAICSDFVAAHGGTIWVESEPGKGSRFCFVIPRDSDPG